MSHVFSLLRRFRKDEQGVFAVLFALLAVVLIAAAGAVVDFSAIEQARTRAQQALDSAALGLQPTIFNAGVTAATIKPQAQAIVTERLADSRIVATLDTPQINVTDGTLHLTGTVNVPMSFVALVGFPSINIKLTAEATRKRLNLEVAMVLDNSNSMSSSSRMTNLIAAAKCASNILYNGACNSTATSATQANVYLAVIPFTLAVNVGTGNASASWMDRSGANSAITLDNFDNDDDDSRRSITSFDRIATINSMRNTTWGGCVEGRIHDTTSSPQRLYDTDDTTPSSSTPYSMFTPYFAPDEPDSGYSNSYINDRPSSCTNKDQGSWAKTITKTGCTSTASSSSSFNNLSCSDSDTSIEQRDQNGSLVNNPSSTEPATINGQPKDCTDSFDNTRTSRNPNRYTNTYTRNCSYTFSDRELLERICKYSGATPSGVSQSSVKGPNGDCPTNAIQPLTSNKSLVTAAINALDPQGGTNIHAGVEWGFRVLSPTEPFIQGQAYSNATSKVMIVMTDGENTAYPANNMNNAQYYGYYSYPYNRRLGTVNSSKDDLQGEMNTRTVQTCNNAKAAGISVYTIGLAVEDTSDPTAIRQMLKDCSSGTGYWYFPTQSSELTTVFTQIANQLSTLRLAK